MKGAKLKQRVYKDVESILCWFMTPGHGPALEGCWYTQRHLI